VKRHSNDCVNWRPCLVARLLSRLPRHRDRETLDGYILVVLCMTEVCINVYSGG